MREIQVVIKVSDGKSDFILKSQANIHALAFLSHEERSHLASIFKAAGNHQSPFAMSPASSSVVGFRRIS